MAAELPDGYEFIDQLLEAGDLEGARDALGEVSGSQDAFAVLRIKLALFEGSLGPGPAQQRLIQLMRRNPNTPGAKELYQEASNLSYRSRTSSASHSHPPPPTGPNSDKKPG